MSSLFEEIKTLCDKINYAILLEPEEGEWFLTDHQGVYWAIDGTVYSGEIREGNYSQDNCMFINIDNGSGFTITKVFNIDDEVADEVFEIKYEGQM